MGASAGLREAIMFLNSKRVVGAPLRWWTVNNKAARMKAADVARA
jgi:hypothetical protein